MIEYKEGFKYQLHRDFIITIPVQPGRSILFGSDDEFTRCGDFIHMYPDGRLKILKGYAWDGPSGPAFDTPNFMVPSLVHDAMYQLMRNSILPKDPFRKIADDLMYDLCIERGMCRLRASWCRRGVRKFGDSAATERKSILTAP